MLKITAAESARKIHQEINRTQAPFPDTSVKTLFESCAEQYPDAIALVHADRRLTYRELNQRANALAARLRHGGLHAGQPTAVCLERSVELIVALIAILKCGCAYLPFDASWPDQRIQTLLTTAGCTRILGTPGSPLACRFPGFEVIPVSPSSLADDEANPDLDVDPESIAYINFTSGSTGCPKGVPIQHRAISRLVFSPAYTRLDAESVLLQLAPVSFDAATFEIWGALLRGGTCVLYPSRLLRFSELKSVLESHGVTTIFLTTALFNSVVDETPEILSQVQTILTGGEAASMRHIERAMRHCGRERIVHVYGPTECTTFATYYPLSRQPEGESALPIGYPVQNTRLYVVDGEGPGATLCGPGQIGEILLAGPGLSPGYLGMSQATRERFVECEIDGVRERVYRTGDHGSLRPDGSVMFHGRCDEQVKINGFRIELGEITHHLGLHPAIQQSYVTSERNESGENRLLAFVVTTEKDCTEAVIRNHLKRTLPSYMVPSMIYLCAAIPLSQNSKVDRNALLSAYRS